MRHWFLALTILFFGCTSSTETSTSKKPNVLFILIDTLRADHLTYAGYSRDTSPNLDALAKESTQYQYAYSGSSWTAPSVATIFTALPPSVHGMMPPNSRTKAASKFSFKLGSDVTTIAEALKGQGYKTAAVTANEWISEKFGYSQGFDYFFMKSRMEAEGVNQKAFKVIDKLLSPNEPYFLYLHYMDPHDPYKAPAPFNTYFQQPLDDPRYQPRERELIRQYDNEIRYVDSKIGEMLAYMRSKHLLDNTTIVVTSDHGEQFKERGNVGHGYTLHDEEIRIPLLIKTPGQKEGKIVSTPVSHMDIFPTLLQLSGVPKIAEHIGVSLVSNEGHKRDVGIISEVSRRYNLKAVVTEDRKKLIGEYEVTVGLYAPLHSEKSLRLFDLKADPFEEKGTELLNSQDQSSKDYFGVLEKLERDSRKYRVDTMEMSDETLDELKSLGYF